jgi:CubicO group peptidase (beta-lactamase class C family)
MAKNFRQVEDAFRKAVDEGVFPGAVALVARNEEVVFEQAFGFRSLVPQQTALQVNTVFDLASLTKPLATTIAIMLLVREGKLRIEDRVTRFLPAFGVFGKHLTTLRHLLTHTSGLPAWKPYYEEVIRVQNAGKMNFVASRGAKSYVMELVHREKPDHPPARRCLYSDLGFMVLGELVETVTGTTLDQFCLERVYRPLGLGTAGFFDLTRHKERRLQPARELIAPTEQCPWRKKIVCGEVHDDNAYAMGGVAGHAGLFASARDVHGMLACLSRSLRGSDSLVPRSIVEEFFAKDGSVENSGFALGWDTPSPGNSASGVAFSPRTIGHLGFTGTSMWWDLERNCYIILLTNRVHPTRKNEKIRDFRPRIHDLIMKAMFS